MIFVKLDEYVALLGTLANYGPIDAAQITSLTSIQRDKLMVALAFLQNQVCVRLEPSVGKALSDYTITERGFRVLRFFTHLTPKA